MLTYSILSLIGNTPLIQLPGENIFSKALGAELILTPAHENIKGALGKDTHVVAVEPKNASALLGHEPGLHQIQGIGDGFVPDVLNRSLIDEVIEVSDDDAIP